MVGAAMPNFAKRDIVPAPQANAGMTTPTIISIISQLIWSIMHFRWMLRQNLCRQAMRMLLHRLAGSAPTHSWSPFTI